MDIGTAEKLNITNRIEQSDQGLYDASGNRMDIIGTLSTKVELVNSGKMVQHQFSILNKRTFSTILLGRDFMKKMGEITFDMSQNKITVNKKVLKGLAIKNKEVARMIGKLEVPARSECTISVQCNSKLSLLDADFEPQRIKGVKGIYFSKAKVKPNLDGEFVITLLNVNSDKVDIPHRTVIGHLVAPKETLHVIPDKDDRKTPTSKESSKIQYGSLLDNEERNEMNRLINSYSDIFAANPKKPKLTTLVTHDIDTGEGKPVKTKIRRIPYAWESEVDKQVKEMLKNDIIEPSCSPWNSPILLTKKKDNSTRFVCDFRELNKLTKKMTYPLPNIQDVIERMAGTTYWTTLDAASAYWSIPLAEEDREKTAFSIPRGKYQFKVTPFGLCSASASYQRMMDICLAGLPPDRVLAYLDDIVIFSKTFAEHMTDIEQVFDRLRIANVSLKMSKCIFGSDSVDFLGYNLSNEGIKPQENLIEAMTNFHRPSKRKEVKQYLGLVGFYRTFIRNFSEISQPLRRLTSEHVTFEWCEKCENAFNTFKRLLSSSPILAFPQPNKPFIVETDASQYSIGGVLSQRKADGNIHPIAYYSVSLSPSEQNWSTYSKEAYALVMATRQWHVFLLGNKFILKTDHNPLVTLRDKKDPRGKFARWLSELEEYEYEVEYLPGKQNVKADTLSRNKSSKANQKPENNWEDKIYTMVQSDTFLEQLKTEQELDPVIKSAKLEISQNQDITNGRLRRVRKQLRISKDVLTKSGRPIVPRSMQPYVTDEIHRSGMLPNHFGFDKTYTLLKKRFYWPNMYGFLQNYLAQCKTCNQCKADPINPKAPLVPIITAESPMEFMALDIAHMEQDAEGYRYLLIMGCIFSKYIEAVPLKDQTAPTIINALWKSWITRHGCPLYVLSDQGSNVDGEAIREICNKFYIQKRRTSGYHSQGNGFAERNIRSIREIMRTVLLDNKLPQVFWRNILPSVIFSLNSTESSATKCTPYEVIYGRYPSLPYDIIFDTVNRNLSAESPAEYLKDLKIQINDTWRKVTDQLKVSRERMQSYYNKDLKFFDYKPGQKVWVKKKTYKPGESKKLSPRKTGPWTVTRKCDNGVNFEIVNDDNKSRKIIHHNRLSPCRLNPVSTPDDHDESVKPVQESDDYESSSDESETTDSNVPVRRYPVRNRRQPQRDGYISWDLVDHTLGDET